MHQHQQRTRQTENATTSPDEFGTPGASGSLMQQANGHAQVARQARDSCAKGAQAEEELHRRRNKSGE